MNIKLFDSLENLPFNHEHATILKNIISEKSLNLILYGPKSSGKKLLIQCIFNSLYPNDKISKIPVSSIKINEETIIYKRNNTLLEINCDTIKQQSKNNLIHFIKQTCSSYSINSDTLKLDKIYIILHNFHLLNKFLQLSLRCIIEKYSNSSIFILTSSKINNIDYSIQSRSFCYRLPLSLEFQMYNLSFYNTKLDSIHNAYVFIKDFIKFNKNFQKMKDSLYELLSYNIDYIQIIKNIIKYCKTDDISISINLFHHAHNADLMCVSASKKLICLEYFIINCNLEFCNKK